MKKKQSSYSRTRNLVLTAVFTAIIIVQTVVPFLGYIPLVFMNATIIPVTVAVGAVLMGPQYGEFLGFIFGMSSLLKNTYAPNYTSFVFSPFVQFGSWKSAVIAIFPRIMIGLVAGSVFLFLDRIGKRKLGLIAAGASGAITNTILVMGGIGFFYGKTYAEAAAKASGSAIQNVSYFIMGVIGTQGIPEAIVAGILTLAIGGALFKVRDHQ